MTNSTERLSAALEGWKTKHARALKKIPSDDREAFLRYAEQFPVGVVAPDVEASISALKAFAWGQTAAAHFAQSRSNSPDGLMDIATERARQVSEEGWTSEHDDEHDGGALAKAAACYAVGDRDLRKAHEWKPGVSSPIWPWDDKWWKPTDRRRELVKAGALIIAEIERLDRLALSSSTEGEKPEFCPSITSDMVEGAVSPSPGPADRESKLVTKWPSEESIDHLDENSTVTGWRACRVWEQLIQIARANAGRALSTPTPVLEREEVVRWRNDAFDAAAEIVRRYVDANDAQEVSGAIGDILALKASSALSAIKGDAS